MLVVLLAGAAPVVACSLTTNLDDLTGGDHTADSAPVIIYEEAAVDHSDAAQQDATLEPTMDAATTSDAGDAANGLDAAGDANETSVDASDAGPQDAGFDGPWCRGQGAHSLCSDFDENTLAFGYSSGSYAWSEDFYGAGTAVIDLDASTSAPGSMYATLAATDAASPSLGASLSATIPSTATTIHLDFDLRPEFMAPLAYGEVDFVDIFEIVNSSYLGLSIGLDTTSFRMNDTAKLSDGGLTNTFKRLPNNIPRGQWTHISIVETRGFGTNGHITISYGGTAWIDQALDTESVGNVSLQLTVGMAAAGGTPATALHIDNIVLDVSP